jgi:hypothetical protein
MTDDDKSEIIAAMRAAIVKSRGYADFFGWRTNRDLEELGVLKSLAESMAADSRLFLTSLKSRGRPNDPPDCEALNSEGQRVAIEVTELVDEDAIRAFKAGRRYDWAKWSKEEFLASVTELVSTKDSKYPQLKDPPYEGGYVLVIFTDEPMLSRIRVEEFLADYRFQAKHIERVILLLGYDPSVGRCPYFELLRASA